ncbi:unnamed protein product [Brassica oleracea]
MGLLIILKPIFHACYCFLFYILVLIFCFCSHFNLLSLIVGMSGELPKRLIKEGEETQVTQINKNCRMVCYMERLEEWLPKELKKVKKDRVFAPIFKLYKNEYHAVTGLQCDTSLSRKELVDFEDDGGFWSTVVRRKEGVTILDLWKNHHEDVKKWSKTRDKLKEKTTIYVLDGFFYALQIWAMEAVPKIGKLCGKKLDKGFMNGPKCVNWMGAAKISYGEFNRLENIFTSEDDIYPYISWSGNYEVL